VQIVTLLKTIHSRMKEWLFAVLLYSVSYYWFTCCVKINSCG
jgi:hypothetical protein